MKHGILSALAGVVLASGIVTGLSVASSCAGDETFLTVDRRSFSDANVVTFERAATKWNGVSTRSLLFTPDHAEWTIIVGLSPPDGCGPPSAPRYCTAGWTDAPTHQVRIYPSLASDELYSTTLHEFGHVLGLGHTQAGIMRPGSGATEFSADDIAECRKHGRCW